MVPPEKKEYKLAIDFGIWKKDSPCVLLDDGQLFINRVANNTYQFPPEQVQMLLEKGIIKEIWTMKGLRESIKDRPWVPLPPTDFFSSIKEKCLEFAIRTLSVITPVDSLKGSYVISLAKEFEEYLKEI